MKTKVERIPKKTESGEVAQTGCPRTDSTANSVSSPPTDSERLVQLEQAVNSLIAELPNIPKQAAEIILAQAREASAQQQTQAQTTTAGTEPGASYTSVPAPSPANPLSNPAIAQLLPILLQMGGQGQTEDPLMQLAKEKMVAGLDLTNQLAASQVQMNQAIVKRFLEGKGL